MFIPCPLNPLNGFPYQRLRLILTWYMQHTMCRVILILNSGKLSIKTYANKILSFIRKYVFVKASGSVSELLTKIFFWNLIWICKNLEQTLQAETYWGSTLAVQESRLFFWTLLLSSNDELTVTMTVYLIPNSWWLFLWFLYNNSEAFLPTKTMKYVWIPSIYHT